MCMVPDVLFGVAADAIPGQWHGPITRATEDAVALSTDGSKVKDGIVGGGRVTEVGRLEWGILHGVE